MKTNSQTNTLLLVGYAPDQTPRPPAPAVVAEYTDPILFTSGLFSDPLDFEDAVVAALARVRSGEQGPRRPDEAEESRP